MATRSNDPARDSVAAAWLSTLLALWLAPFLTALAYRGNIGLVPIFNVFQLLRVSYLESSLAPIIYAVNIGFAVIGVTVLVWRYVYPRTPLGI
jgi:hypothetical protein